MKRAFNCGTGSGGFEPGNSCAGGGGGGGGVDSSGGSSGGGSDEGGGGGNSARGERLRDRIEGTDAEVKAELAKGRRDISRIEKKIEAVKGKIKEIDQREQNVLKSLQQKADAATARRQDLDLKLKAVNERIAANKAKLAKYKR
jgi:chromosome segregation ATPase